MKKLPLYLIMSIPAASVLMGIITLIIAFSGPDQELSITEGAAEAPLSKTSWRSEEARDVD